MTECSGYGVFVISVWILPKIQENDIAHWVIYETFMIWETRLDLKGPKV